VIQPGPASAVFLFRITSKIFLMLLNISNNKPPRRKRTGYPGISLIAASSGEFTLRD